MASIELVHRPAKAEIEDDQTKTHAISTQSALQTESATKDSAYLPDLSQDEWIKRGQALDQHRDARTDICAKFNKMAQELSGDPTLDMGSHGIGAIGPSPGWGSFCEEAKTDDKKTAAVRFIKEAMEHRNMELQRWDQAFSKFIRESYAREDGARIQGGNTVGSANQAEST